MLHPVDVCTTSQSQRPNESMKECPRCSASVVDRQWLCACGYEFSGPDEGKPSFPSKPAPKYWARGFWCSVLGIAAHFVAFMLPVPLMLFGALMIVGGFLLAVHSLTEREPNSLLRGISISLSLLLFVWWLVRIVIGYTPAWNARPAGAYDPTPISPARGEQDAAPNNPPMNIHCPLRPLVAGRRRA